MAPEEGYLGWTVTLTTTSDEAAVREHARLGGFPANTVSRIRAVIDPTTSEV